MGYPVAYRKSSAPRPSGPGFQGNPAGVPVKPANDNFPLDRRPPPVPANDNHVMGGFTAKARPFVRGALLLRRLHPLGRVWDIYEAGKVFMDINDAQAQPHGVPVWNSPAPWFKSLNCGCPEMTFSRLYDSCRSACAAVPGQQVFETPPFPNARVIGSWGTTGARYPFSGQPLYTFPSAIYEKPFGDPTPWNIARWQNQPAPGSNPNIDPLTRPGLPTARPKQLPYRILPYRQTNPWRSPSEQSQSGNSFDYNPHVPGPKQVAIPAPGTTPRPVPGHIPKPPGPRVKERKSRLKAGMAVALRAGYSATEAIDAIEAVHKALPKKYQAGSKSTPQEKLAAIYRHYDKLDMNKVVLNLAANHIIDLIIGRSSAKAAEFFKRYGISGYGQHF